MTIKRWVCAGFALLLLINGRATGAESLSPLETLKGPIDQIVTMLNDPSYRDPVKREEQRNKIWEVARPLFDFNELSRRTLGQDWGRFSEEEKNRFTVVFAEFLGNTYIDKIQGEYHNERIVFITELVRGPVALARTKLLREGLEIPIDYRMKQVDGHWKIYDVLVENGVSLVRNYRVQFRSILQKNTPAELIQRLEEKLEAQRTTVG